MAAQAAHVVDAVVSAVPVLSVVFPFRAVAISGNRPAGGGAVERFHYHAIAQHFGARAKSSDAVGKTHPSAIAFVQRLGSSLNLRLR